MFCYIRTNRELGLRSSSTTNITIHIDAKVITVNHGLLELRAHSMSISLRIPC